MCVCVCNIKVIEIAIVKALYRIERWSIHHLSLLNIGSNIPRRILVCILQILGEPLSRTLLQLLVKLLVGDVDVPPWNVVFWVLFDVSLIATRSISAQITRWANSS